MGVGQVECSVQQCRNGKPSLFLKWKLAPGRKRELGVWRVLYLRGTRKGGAVVSTYRKRELGVWRVLYLSREALRGH